MSTVHHGRRGAVKAAQAAGGIAAFIALAEAAHVVSVLAGPSGLIAGVALVAAVFAACWYVHRVRPLLHPVSQPPREPRLPAQAGNAPAEPARQDLLPVL